MAVTASLIGLCKSSGTQTQPGTFDCPPFTRFWLNITATNVPLSRESPSFVIAGKQCSNVQLLGQVSTSLYPSIDSSEWKCLSPSLPKGIWPIIVTTSVGRSSETVPAIWAANYPVRIGYRELDVECSKKLLVPGEKVKLGVAFNTSLILSPPIILIGGEACVDAKMGEKWIECVPRGSGKLLDLNVTVEVSDELGGNVTYYGLYTSCMSYRQPHVEAVYFAVGGSNVMDATIIMRNLNVDSSKVGIGVVFKTELMNIECVSATASADVVRCSVVNSSIAVGCWQSTVEVTSWSKGVSDVKNKVMATVAGENQRSYPLPLCFFAPIVYSVTPTAGSKGDVVTISGNHFGTRNDLVLSTSIVVGGAPCTMAWPPWTGPSWQSSSSIKCTLGDGITGSVVVSIRGALSNNNVTFIFLKPKVIGVSGCDLSLNDRKARGCPTSGGAMLQISVKNLSPEGNWRRIESLKAWIGGRICRNASWSSTSNLADAEWAMDCVLPEGDGITSSVIVSVDGVESDPEEMVWYGKPVIERVSGCRKSDELEDGTVDCSRDGKVEMTLRGHNLGKKGAQLFIGGALGENVSFVVNHFELRFFLPTGIGARLAAIVVVAGQLSEPRNLVSYELCPKGQYRGGEFGRVCVNCSVGKYADGEGRLQCSDCPAGTFASGEGSIACLKCPVGTQSGEKAVKCVKCQQGEIQPEPNRCEKCSKGR